MRRPSNPASWLPLALLAPLLVLALIYLEYERRQEELAQARSLQAQQELRDYVRDMRALHGQFRASLAGVEADYGASLSAEDLPPLCRRAAGAKAQAEHYLSSLRAREFPAEARDLHFWLERELVAYVDYTLALELFCQSGEAGYVAEVAAAWERGHQAGRRVVQQFARLTPESPAEPAVWTVRPTPAPTPSWAVAVELANVRACPELSCEIVANLAQATPVEVIEEVEGQEVLGTSSWYRVRAQGVPGEAFMHASTLSQATPQP